MTGTVLVTGAGGLVGRSVVDRLVALGQDVVASDLPGGPGPQVVRRWRDSPRVRVAWCDLTDAAQVDALLAGDGPDAVVHLAAVIPPLCYARPALARAVNVDGTRHLVDALERLAPSTRLVHVSSVAVHGARNPHRHDDLLDADTPLAPTDLYGELKAEAERTVRASRLDHVVLRLGGVLTVQPGRSLDLDLLHFESLLPADNRLHSVDVRDVAHAVAAATTADVVGEVLMIGGDATHRLRQHEVTAGFTAALGMDGAIPAGRPGDPDDDTTWFATDWMDTTRAQQALDFQHHSWPAMLDETRRSTGRLRYLNRLMGPVLHEVLRRSNARRGTVAPFRQEAP